MKKNAVKLFFILICVATFSLFANAQTISVSGSLNSVKRGANGKGTIVLEIPEELHINSNQPTCDFMIPTSVQLNSKDSANFKINYPKGKDKKFDFSEDEINVYQGKTTINFGFKVPKNLKSKTIIIRAIISYQACTNEVCYQPQKKEISLKGTVK